MEPATETERQEKYQKLVDLLLSIKSEVFSHFDVCRTHYDSDGGRIGVDILIPNSARLRSSRPRPVMVRIHGGFLVTGSSLFPAWFGKWILDYAHLNDAVIVSPNYRLLPEVGGFGILQDIRSFWSWMDTGGAQQFLDETHGNVILDIDRTLLVGESAGGYLAVQSLLNQYTCPKALMVLYPMLDMLSDYYCKPFSKPICGVPNFPDSVVDDFIKASSGNPPITEADPPSRLEFALAAVQTGRYQQILGNEPELFPLERIRRMGLPPRTSGSGSAFPPTFILHGEQDSAVPVSGTHKFVKVLKEADPTVQLHVAIRPGDHGFDATATLDEAWLKQGLDFITHAWQSPVSTPLEPLFQVTTEREDLWKLAEK